MSKFMLGCNYWASHAGTEMWRNWNEESVREDLKVLSKNGIEYLRVFPNWRDFQPVWPLFDGVGVVREYRVHEDKLPENKYYIDETMLQRFELFCDIAEEFGMKLIVGILTGFMSGRTFIPPALYGKDLFKDPVALNFEMKFIEGFVQRIKAKKAVYAWNPGNECNNLSKAEDYNTAEAWLGIICNAIRANDPTRQVISGMHGLSVEGVWRIDAQKAYTDMLTTHPYPYFVPHCTKDNFSDMRTLLHATTETKYYADLSGKPCLVEEIGNLGNMMCDEETAAGFLKTNMFSNWAHGSPGVIWWCANDQMMLETPPYCWNMCEVELGLLDKNRKEKPLLLEMKKFSEFVRNIDFELPKAHEDGVCLVTDGQDQWGAAYMTTLLAKMAKVNLKYAYASNGIPDSDVYMLPSVASLRMMPSYRYKELKQKIHDGATLYLSVNNPVISEFEELTGVRIKDSRTCYDGGTFEFSGKKMTYTKGRQFTLTETRAKVLCRDEKQNPLITVSEYGKGMVYFVNFPMETRLLDVPDIHKTDYSEVYRMIFEAKIANHVADSDVKCIGITEHHENENSAYIVLVNYSGNEVKTNLTIKPEYKIEKVIYGNIDNIAPYDATVIRVSK
ncbi:MAG: cellulase family glycosylhydrolase [Clostridia bacterium]|nr:cellulase family glycosylhydrolase [Clostridia bacterium]